MTDVAIRVENLGKRYRIGKVLRRHDTLRDALMHNLHGTLGWLRRNGHANGSDTFWALKDVSFEVKRGEVVGIIGRNGAGKSTLLKILSRITDPTEGAVDMYGRVGSLLEVGTGFHPELTGRENIYLSGAILGMKRADIVRKFDEIVVFAEVEKFIDTPVKHYSSGMYVRLAFAVAAHLEPEILIVDEVLAVGDAAFQKKCLGKMGEVAKEGRTVMLVSHNMAAIKSLCMQAILIESGTISSNGDVNTVVDTYSSAGRTSINPGLIPPDAARRHSTGEVVFRSIQLSDIAGSETTQLFLGEPFRITFSLQARSEIPEAAIEINILASDGVEVASSRTLDGSDLPFFLPLGEYEFSVEMGVFLIPGKYSIQLIIHKFTGTVVDWVERALDFMVINVARDSPDNYRYWPTKRGYVRIPAKWNLPREVRFQARAIISGTKMSSKS